MGAGDVRYLAQQLKRVRGSQDLADAFSTVNVAVLGSVNEIRDSLPSQRAFELFDELVRHSELWKAQPASKGGKIASYVQTLARVDRDRAIAMLRDLI
jgi:hypothetical protein